MVKPLVLIGHFSVHSTVTDDPIQITVGHLYRLNLKFKHIINCYLIIIEKWSHSYRNARIFVFDGKVYKTGERFSEGA